MWSVVFAVDISTLLTTQEKKVRARETASEWNWQISSRALPVMTCLSCVSIMLSCFSL